MVSLGLQHGRKLPHVPGLSALEFLEACNTDSTAAKAVVEGKWVVVVGGGSVAVDASCTNKAGSWSYERYCSVRVESLNEMRADVDEIRLAQPHRVTMIPERTVEGMSEDGVSLRLRHASQPKEYDFLHADTVIVAIGRESAEDAEASLLNSDHFTYAGDAISGGQIVAGASYCQRKARRG